MVASATPKFIRPDTFEDDSFTFSVRFWRFVREYHGNGKIYGVGAVIVIPGEGDAGNSNYENDLYQ